MQRYTYYERQLGKKPDEIEKAIPEFGEMSQDDKDSLAKMNLTTMEPEVGLPRDRGGYCAGFGGNRRKDCQQP